MVYLFFGNFKGFQVVANDTEFLFEFNDFAVEKEVKNRSIIDCSNEEIY